MPGISASFSPNDSATKTFYGLFQVHHRGQGSSGLSVAGDKSMRTYSDNGLMQTVFPKKIMNTLIHPDDYASIGHVGKGNENQKRIPPIEIDSKDFKLSLAMDGIILNHPEIDKKFGLNTKTDEELFGKIFGKYLKSNDIEGAAECTMKDLDKAYYSLVMLALDKNRKESKLIGLRDKRGVRPMYMGKNGKDFLIASESGAIDVLERLENKMKERRDVNPGEMLVASKDGFHEEQIVPPEPAHGSFEWAYTARPDAIMNGINAHEVRKRLGRNLVKLHNINDDGNSIVLGVPDSGRSSGKGISEASGIPFDEGIIKNQYVMRTYIIKDPEKRRISAFLKHNTIGDVVKGKRVIISDDSIVRGTISEEISRIVKDAGAKEVNFAVSYAPIFRPCFEDDPNKKLAAAGLEGLDIYEIGRRIASKFPGIDNVFYNDVESVIKAIGLPENNLCTYCIKGRNPFEN